MILWRIGNKMKLASKIIPLFPKHDYYVELFFGAGGIFFNKPLASWNLLNDNDAEITNLYDVLSRRRAEFEAELDIMPNHSDLFCYWKKNREIDAIRRAVRFVYLSNFSYMGNEGTQRIAVGDNSKMGIREKLNSTCEMLRDCTFTNYDFREVIPRISFRHGAADKERCFIYSDPPYCNTTGNYDTFTEKDTQDLFSILANSGCKYAISEFETPFITELAREYKLHSHYISERRTLKTRNVEILLTNYSVGNTLF